MILSDMEGFTLNMTYAKKKHNILFIFLKWFLNKSDSVSFNKLLLISVLPWHTKSIRRVHLSKRDEANLVLKVWAKISIKLTNWTESAQNCLKTATVFPRLSTKWPHLFNWVCHGFTSIHIHVSSIGRGHKFREWFLGTLSCCCYHIDATNRHEKSVVWRVFSLWSLVVGREVPSWEIPSFR